MSPPGGAASSFTCSRQRCGPSFRESRVASCAFRSSSGVTPPPSISNVRSHWLPTGSFTTAKLIEFSATIPSAFDPTTRNRTVDPGRQPIIRYFVTTSPPRTSSSASHGFPFTSPGFIPPTPISVVQIRPPFTTSFARDSSYSPSRTNSVATSVPPFTVSTPSECGFDPRSSRDTATTPPSSATWLTPLISAGRVTSGTAPSQRAASSQRPSPAFHFATVAAVAVSLIHSPPTNAQTAMRANEQTAFRGVVGSIVGVLSACDWAKPAIDLGFKHSLRKTREQERDLGARQCTGDSGAVSLVNGAISSAPTTSKINCIQFEKIARKEPPIPL